MARDHEHFVTALVSEHAVLQREFYVRIRHVIDGRTSPYKQLSSPERVAQAHREMAQKVQEVLTGLQRVGLVARRLVDEELVNYYLSCVHTRDAETYGVAQSTLSSLDVPPHASLPANVKGVVPATSQPSMMDLALPPDGDIPLTTSKEESAVRTPSQVSSSKLSDLTSLPELVQPASIEQTPHYVKVHFQTEEYSRWRVGLGYPAHLIAGWVDQLLALDEPYVDVLLFVQTLDSTNYVRTITRRLSGHQATLFLDEQHGKLPNPYIAAAATELAELREQLVAKTEYVHAFSLYLCSRADSPHTLKERDVRVASWLRSLEIQSIPLEYEHMQAWLSCVDARDLLQRTRKLDTSSLVASFPFCSADLSTEEPGALVGMTSTGGFVLIDPASTHLENGHELIFARSGAGKSYYQKVRLMRHLLLGMAAIVVDPEQEYASICERFGGTTIHLSAGGFPMNPFDFSFRGEEENPLREKLGSLSILFDMLLAEKDKGVLNQLEKSHLMFVVEEAYKRRGITAERHTHHLPPPNMREVHRLLKQNRDPYALAQRLARYVPLFPEQTSVALDNALMVFQTRDLSQDLLPVGLYLITEFVWGQARRQRIPRLLLIDEAWTLMKFPAGGHFLADMSRRARKYQLYLRLVTQDAADFLSSDAGRTIMLNASMKFLMKQDATTIDSVASAFHLSDAERSYLLGASKGEGLFFCQGSHIPLSVISSPLEHHIISTAPEGREPSEVVQVSREQVVESARSHRQPNQSEINAKQTYQEERRYNEQLTEAPQPPATSVGSIERAASHATSTKRERVRKPTRKATGKSTSRKTTASSSEEVESDMAVEDASLVADDWLI